MQFILVTLRNFILVMTALTYATLFLELLLAFASIATARVKGFVLLDGLGFHALRHAHHAWRAWPCEDPADSRHRDPKIPPTRRTSRTMGRDA